MYYIEETIMQKIQTPMQQVKGHINNFKDITKGMLKEVKLNRSASKYNPHGGDHGYGAQSKGVESDFIIIFRSSDDKVRRDYSGVGATFSFVFDYIDKPINDHKIAFSVKADGNDNESIIMSDFMTVDTFKSSIKNINNKLKDSIDKNGSISYSDIINVISNDHLNISIDIESELKVARIKVADFLKSKEDAVIEAGETVSKLREEYTKALNKSKVALKNTKEHKELTALKNRQHELEKILKVKDSKFQEKNMLGKLHNNIVEAKAKKQNALDELKSSENKIVSKYPSLIAARLKKRRD